eukprot:1157807-Pelagomonas_calceolata.AAC.3
MFNPSLTRKRAESRWYTRHSSSNFTRGTLSRTLQSMTKHHKDKQHKHPTGILYVQNKWNSLASLISKEQNLYQGAVGSSDRCPSLREKTSTTNRV